MIDVSDYSKKLVSDIVNAINGVEIPPDDRSRIAGALFDIVHEHHQAIVILLGKRLYGSASALMRSIFESYVRGVWFMKCATAKDIADFQKDKSKDGTFEDRLKEIEKIDAVAHGGLIKMKKTAWAGLNSYTHGGMRPVSRRFVGMELKANYAEEEILEIERLTSAFAVLAVFQIAELANNTDLMGAAEAMAGEFKANYS
jgi:hypothetical protein